MPRLSAVLAGVFLSACATVAPTPRALPAAFPLPDEVAHEEGTFPGAGGLQLFHQRWGPKEGPVRGALVVVHGLKDHSGRYAQFAAGLARQGFAVYAFDLRGHGRSDGERVAVDVFDDYLRDLGAFVDRVRVLERGKPLFVFGHSMGGAIVALYAMTRQPYVQGVILSAPAIKVDVSGVTVDATLLLAELLPDLPLLALSAEDCSRDAAVVQEQKGDPLVFQPAGPARTAAELFRAMHRIDQRAEDLNVPVLLLHGTADRVTDPRGSAALLDASRSADKTLKVYPGLFHDLLHEPERAQVASDIALWLLARSSFDAARPLGNNSQP